LTLARRLCFNAGMTLDSSPFSFRGYWLGQRSNNLNWQILWRQPGSRRLHRRSAGTDNLEIAKETLVAFAGQRTDLETGRPIWLRLSDALHWYEQHMQGRPNGEAYACCWLPPDTRRAGPSRRFWLPPRGHCRSVTHRPGTG